MPLFIDLHVDDRLTPDVVKQCHVADKAIQAKYGVRYLQILLNQPQGHLFCLVEGPDKESCARVHQEAHGNIACNILEITQSDFSALLAGKPTNETDITLNHDGTLDTGNRIILALQLIGSPENYRAAKEIIVKVIHLNNGKHGESLGNHLVAVFDSCALAVDAALQIRNKVTASIPHLEIRMGLSIGPPLKEKGNFFEDVQRSANHFSFVASNGEIVVASKVQQLYNGDIKAAAHPVKVIGLPDEEFLNQVMECVEKFWDKGEITVTDFARELGMSKSQIARKLKSLSVLSPNDFFKEFRLRKSILLMEDHRMNIAEITMAIGFSNPSYFTKCFRKRFGKSPSDYMIRA